MKYSSITSAQFEWGLVLLALAIGLLAAVGRDDFWNSGFFRPWCKALYRHRNPLGHAPRQQTEFHVALRNEIPIPPRKDSCCVLSEKARTFWIAGTPSGRDRHLCLARRAREVEQSLKP
jgi:hypothetical protein